MTVEPTPSAEIENLLAEDRKFPQDPAFTAQANATADLYARAEAVVGPTDEDLSAGSE